MSRIGKRIITLEKTTEAKLNGSVLSVKGPKGTLERSFGPEIEIKIVGNTISLVPKDENVVSMWGTSASHIVNMVKGVNETFTKKLIIEGIGYKAEIRGTDVVLNLGFSHQIIKKISPTLKVTSDKGILTVTGMNKDEVGQFTAEIRALKKPEPYKGKGIRYEDEIIRRKQGKKSV